MKTKIIYISGNEIFDVADIRAAFEEVRNALNLDKTTVLFGVPVDADDAGLMQSESKVVDEFIPDVDNADDEDIKDDVVEEIIEEPVVVEQPKKRGRPNKPKEVEENTDEEVSEEKVVPILSFLSTKEETTETEVINQEIEIISEVSDEEENQEEIIQNEIPEETVEDIDEQEMKSAEDVEEEAEEEADLEKLLSAMTPLQEDVLDDEKVEEAPIEPEYEDDISVDATLEQLATEFAETQDKIATESKSSPRSKIGKLRNILPFKQSKHKDQGLGDLFGWAGIAANDEDFSVPGFFTNAASKK